MAGSGEVISISGSAAGIAEVYIVKANGEKIPLKQGDSVNPGDAIITPEGVVVEIRADNGEIVTVAAEQTVAFTGEMLATGVASDSKENAIDEATIQMILQAVQEGQDISEALAETASGITGGAGSEGGFSFVDLPRILFANNVSSLSDASTSNTADEDIPPPSLFSLPTESAPAAPTVQLSPAALTVQLSPASDTGVPNDNITNDSTPTISGTGVPGDIIRGTIGVTSYGPITVPLSGIWTFTPPATLPDGPVIVTVEAETPDGQVVSGTPVTIVIDTTPPVVGLNDIALTNDSTPELTGTVDDPTAEVVVTIAGVDYPAVNNGDGTWTLADDVVATLADGTTPVTVSATDVAGNTGTGDGTVTVDTPPAAPTVALTTDSGGDATDLITNDGTLTVTPNEPGNAIEYSTDGGATWTTTPPTATEGPNTVSVREITLRAIQASLRTSHSL